MIEYTSLYQHNICAMRYCDNCGKRLGHKNMDPEACGAPDWNDRYYEGTMGDLDVDLCPFCADEDEEDD